MKGWIWYEVRPHMRSDLIPGGTLIWGEGYLDNLNLRAQDKKTLAKVKKIYLNQKYLGNFFRLKGIFIILVLSVFLLDGLIAVYKFNSQQGSIKIYDSNDRLVYEYIKDLKGYQTPIKLSSLPKHIPNSVMAAEDSRFYVHFGVDPISMIRALKSNIEAGTVVSGGSTITQQVARSNLMKKHTDANSFARYIRKIREINAAFFLEIAFSKDRIMEYYLNNVYFGNKSYGIESASQTYFNKSANELTLSEAALLAGSIKSPEVLNPLESVNSLERRNEVLTLMFDKDFIGREQLEISKEFPLGINFRSRPAKHLHFIEFVLEEARRNLDANDIKDLNGMKIYTTLNSGLSEYVQEQVQVRVKILSEKHKLSNGAVAILSTDDSSILTMVGSADYFDDSIQGAVNMATSLRQPGSALKPITYAQAFFEGYLTEYDIIVDEKTTFIDKNGKSYVPYNYNGVFNGEITARVALASSLNLPAVKVLSMIGIESMIDAAQKLGITDLKEPDRYGLSVTLGGGEVTLLDLSNVYNSFARGGIYKPSFTVKKILNKDDEAVYDHKEELGREVWGEKSTEIADTIFSILSDRNAKVLGFGRNNVLILPFEAASKTGTTTDWHDNWTFGYTRGTQSDFAVGAWVGNADNTPMYDIDGVTGAGPIWRSVMLKTYDLLNTHPDNAKQSESFSEPKTLIDGSKGARRPDPVYKITNPAPNSEYQSLPHEDNFERITFEITISNSELDVVSVEYILNGNSIGKYYKKDNFRYLWHPKKGNYTLEARFLDSSDQVITVDVSNFVVYSQEP